MNKATILGLILGLTLISYAAYDSAGEAGVSPYELLHIMSLLIVVGGALAATSIAFKLTDVLSVFKNFKRAFKEDEYSNKDIVEDLISLSESQRKGELKNALNQAPESMPFRLKVVEIGCQYVIEGYSKEVITDILETMEENRSIREERQANVLRTMGNYTPAFGMIGTLLGLVLMLASMANSSSDNMMEGVTKGMSVALITTFYGSLFANLIFLPFSEKLKEKSELKETESALILEGVNLIYDKKHPILVKDKLNAFLASEERIKEE